MRTADGYEGIEHGHPLDVQSLESRSAPARARSETSSHHGSIDVLERGKILPAQSFRQKKLPLFDRPIRTSKLPMFAERSSQDPTEIVQFSETITEREAEEQSLGRFVVGASRIEVVKNRRRIIVASEVIEAPRPEKLFLAVVRSEAR